MLRGHFTIKGEPKKRLTMAEAVKAAALHSKKAYRCDFCWCWHIGGEARKRGHGQSHRR